jgi:hypothetical protein
MLIDDYDDNDDDDACTLPVISQFKDSTKINQNKTFLL